MLIVDCCCVIFEGIPLLQLDPGILLLLWHVKDYYSVKDYFSVLNEELESVLQRNYSMIPIIGHAGLIRRACILFTLILS